MIYLLNVFISLLYFYTLGRLYQGNKCNTLTFFIITSPIFLLWLIICASQYFVGTDYGVYIMLFNGHELDRFEPGFVYIIKIANDIGISGQSLYLVFYTIGFFFLFLIFRGFKFKYLYVFIFLYLCVSGLFHNQLNILRQIIATYIGSFGALIYIKNRKLLGASIIILAASMHYSALILFLVCFYKLLLKVNYKFLLVTLGAALVFSVVLSTSIIEKFDFLIPGYYLRLLKGGAAIIEERSFLLKATKYILIPIYFLSIWRVIKGLDLSKAEETLYKIGVLSFCLKISMLNLTIISRLFDVFLIFTLYPLYYYFKYLIEHQNIRTISLLVSFLFLIYLSKILIFPSGEYLYQSVISSFF